MTQGAVYSFPEEAVSRQVKESKYWLLKYARAALSNYNMLPLETIGWSSRDQYEQIRAYVNGRQDITKYKRWRTPSQDPSANTDVVDWSTEGSPLPKYRQIALGILGKQSFYLEINPVDPLALGEVEDELLSIRTKIQMRQMLQQAGMGQFANQAPLQREPDEPEDLDGLAIMEMGPRHRTAMEVEQVWELIDADNKYTAEQLQQMREDWFDYGCAVSKDYMKGDTVGIRVCDMRRIVMSYCAYRDFRDLRYMGEIEVKIPSQIVPESNGQITREEIERVFRLGDPNIGSFGVTIPYTSYSSFDDFWGRGKLYVLDLEIYTSDPIDKEEKTDTRGNTRIRAAQGDRKPDTRGYKYTYSRKWRQEVYHVKWIVGTDIIYNYGRLKYIKREPQDESRVIGSYHIAACRMHDMRVYSRSRAMIPLADQIYMAKIRIQHTLNSVIPSGWLVDMSSLEEIAWGAGGKGETWSPQQVTDFWRQTGVLFYRSKSLVGQNEKLNVPAIRLDGGVGSEIAECWNTIINCTAELKDILGLNDLTDASTPDQKTLNGVAQVAVQGTNNALSDLFDAERRMTRDLARSAVIRAQDIIRTTGGTAFTQALGKGTMLVLRSIKDITKYIYTTEIVEMPTGEELAAFNQSLQLAIQRDQITVADQMQLDNIRNFKQKQSFLAYRVRKNAELKQQQAMEQQQQNGQIQMQSAQAAEQAKQQTLQMEYQLKMQLEQMSKDLEQRNDIARGELQLERERIASTGRVEASFVQARERQDASMRDNTAKLISDGHAAAVPIVNQPAELKSNVAPATSEQQPILPIPGFSFLEGAQHEQTEGPLQEQVEQPEPMQM